MTLTFDLMTFTLVVNRLSRDQPMLQSKNMGGLVEWFVEIIRETPRFEAFVYIIPGGNRRFRHIKCGLLKHSPSVQHIASGKVLQRLN